MTIDEIRNSNTFYRTEYRRGAEDARRAALELFGGFPQSGLRGRKKHRSADIYSMLTNVRYDLTDDSRAVSMPYSQGVIRMIGDISIDYRVAGGTYSTTDVIRHITDVSGKFMAYLDAAEATHE